MNEFGKHLDEPREIGKKKEKVSSKDKKMAKKQIGESLGITAEQAKQILDNICVECGQPVNEDLRNWFKKKWVNIGKKVDGKHPPCGTSGKKRGYAKCVPASKAASMSKKEKESATRRKRAAQNKANRGGSQSRGQGKKPINVSTHTKRSGKKSGTGKGS